MTTVTFLLLFLVSNHALGTEAFVVPRPPRVLNSQQQQQQQRKCQTSTTRLETNLPPPMLLLPQVRLPTATTSLHASYQDLMEKLPTQSVLDAVEKSNDGGPVIASDVSAMAGVGLSQARKDLTALASLTQGDIAVSKDGELIYSFPRNLKGVLASNSLKYKVLSVFQKAWPAIFWAVRVSFGVVLLASLAAIFSTIFFLSQSGGSSENDDRRRDRGFGGSSMSFGGGMGYDPFWGPSPFDFFFYRPYYGYYAMPGESRRDPEEMGFLESIFSYIFGDGDPNRGLEEKRLSLAANMIRDNKGSVTAEQLAPFCDGMPSFKRSQESGYVDESFVLPIVTQLNGEPLVTKEGDIVYVFPDLQRSASSSNAVLPSSMSSSSAILKRAGLNPRATTGEIKQLLSLNGISTRGVLEKKDLVRVLERALPPMTGEEEEELMVDDPSILIEREYKFSLAPEFNRFLAGGLGVLNLGGSLYLGNMLSTYAMYGVRLPSYYGAVQAGFPFLLAYAVLFNAIPLARSFWIKSENDRIRQRNKLRQEYKAALGSGIGSLARKLKAAKQMRTNMKQIGAGPNEVVFDTRESATENEKKREAAALDDFDKLLEEDTSSFQ